MKWTSPVSKSKILLLLTLQVDYNKTCNFTGDGISRRVRRNCHSPRGWPWWRLLYHSGFPLIALNIRKIIKGVDRWWCVDVLLRRLEPATSSSLPVLGPILGFRAQCDHWFPEKYLPTKDLQALPCNVAWLGWRWPTALCCDASALKVTVSPACLRTLDLKCPEDEIVASKFEITQNGPGWHLWNLLQAGSRGRERERATQLSCRTISHCRAEPMILFPGTDLTCLCHLTVLAMQIRRAPYPASAAAPWPGSVLSWVDGTDTEPARRSATYRVGV